MGVSTAFGGLEDAPDEKPDRFGKGAEVNQGRMTTLFEDAVVRPGGKDGLGISDKRYLQITMKVTNTSAETISAQTMDHALVAVRADGKVIKEADPSSTTDGPRFVTIADGQTYSQLHPGVPATVVMAFELRAGEPAPKNVQIDVGVFEWHENFFQRTHYWQMTQKEVPLTAEDRKKGRTVRFASTVAAQVDLPVRVEEV